MAGIYLHIPFCRKTCHYCNFHFSTSLKNKLPFLNALKKEILLRKDNLKNKKIKTIYFGGGTPSLLETGEIENLLSLIDASYHVSKGAEITLEANPEDLYSEKIKALSNTKINRLSIGVQSFDDERLKMMNRNHNGKDSEKCLEIARRYFDNISIDLIYGIPNLSSKDWEKNIEKALNFDIPHISSYALTVEKKTTLSHLIKTKKYPNLDDDLAALHFEILSEKLASSCFEHYEISNFAKLNFLSKHNSNYWLQKPYLGFGPSAHGFLKNMRYWNVYDNNKYICALNEGKLLSKKEFLNEKDLYNEYLMTRLRTKWGISLKKIQKKFGTKRLEILEKDLQKFVENKSLELKKNQVKISKKKIFLTDGIVANFFWI